MKDITTWVLASTNAGKLRELETLFAHAELPIQLRSLSDFVAKLGKIPLVEETAETFAGNADIKALAYNNWTQEIVLADDSGLSIEALRGAPGVRSARYADPPSDAANLNKVLRELGSENNRRATFHCALAVAQSGKVLTHFHGELHGTIAHAAHGTGGFGYDPIFIPDGKTRTLGELGANEKNQISHRAQALSKLIQSLKSGDFVPPTKAVRS